MPIERQIAVFADADAVVSRHGAALFWLICMRERSIVFEYGSKGSLATAFYHYEMLARYAGLRHVSVDPNANAAMAAAFIVDAMAMPV